MFSFTLSPKKPICNTQWRENEIQQRYEKYLLAKKRQIRDSHLNKVWITETRDMEWKKSAPVLTDFVLNGKMGDVLYTSEGSHKPTYPPPKSWQTWREKK